ncbi:MAG TPA: cytochrome c oxidase subunit 3 [Pyrinomonadaceae bacterium]|jgi:cytochrome c oxidase subunit 3|nr:cytochrome c oxidase subunit 3 [Pyrinomonadaceae bacterium]
MDTMVTSTERVVQNKVGSGGGLPGPKNGSLRGGGNGGRGGDDSSQRFSASKYRIGMWVALAGISMMFTALTSAYIVRANTSNDWRPIMMPRLLWVSTALIFLSSISFEVARRSLKQGKTRIYQRWLLLTVLLGLAFLATQLMSWRQLVAQGIYVSSNPHSSFFYVLTGAHGLHLLGGILALDFLLLRSWRNRYEEDAVAKRQAVANAVALYWHFMDGLWIYLFLLLFLWR